jgi:hypothetical protein
MPTSGHLRARKTESGEYEVHFSIDADPRVIGQIVAEAIRHLNGGSPPPPGLLYPPPVTTHNGEPLVLPRRDEIVDFIKQQPAYQHSQTSISVRFLGRKLPSVRSPGNRDYQAYLGLNERITRARARIERSEPTGSWKKIREPGKGRALTYHWVRS